MNKEKIQKLADKLRKMRHPEHFSQSYWGEKTACGTAACIAGHAVLMEGYQLQFSPNTKLADHCKRGDKGEVVIEELAPKILGLSDSEARKLFNSNPEETWPTAYAERWRETTTIRRRKARAEAQRKLAVHLLDGLVLGTVDLTF